MVVSGGSCGASRKGCGTTRNSTYGVEGPEDGEEERGVEVGLLEVVAEVGGGLETGAVDDPEDVEHGDAAHGVVAPLVGGLDEGADQTGDDHDQVEEDGDEDGGEGEAGDEEDLEEEERGGDGPVDVASVPDGAGRAGAVNLSGAIVGKLNGNGGSAEVGGHGKVGDRSGGQDGSREVVEGALAAGELERPDHGAEAGSGHYGEDSPEEVGAMGGDVDVSDSRVDAQGLVARSLEELNRSVHDDR
ncbi:hypothetical protein L1887_49101 [Cichorium endivia]|nr:hypothetical protein L1887_49101 [Cichorium endivia]